MKFFLLLLSVCELILCNLNMSGYDALMLKLIY